jgi:hypothetical protein
MTQWTIVLAHTKDKQPGGADATSIGLRLLSDGAPYQYFAVTATGQELDLDHPDLAAHAGFWDAAAIVGAIQIRELLPKLTPAADPTQPVEVRLNFSMVDAVLQADKFRPIPDATTIDEWTE